MSTVKFFVKQENFHEVFRYISKSRVKYYPIRKHGEFYGTSFQVGYLFELDKNHPIVSFLILKFDLKTLSNELVQL